MINKTQISIIVCTHRRFNLLKLAVQSLCNQTVSKDIFEIIVVDNDISPNKEVILIVEEARTIINIRYIHESVIGLSIARNVGGKAASTEYIGYMDDDAKAKDNYIETLFNLVETNQYDIIGGPYFPFYLSNKPNWFQDKYESSDSGGSHFFQSNEFLNGTNMVYRKSILHKANWFNISFGMKGSQIAYGEETELQIRLWKRNKNLKVFYSCELIVYHFVPPHKMTLKDKFRRSYFIGKSHSNMWISSNNIPSSRNKAFYILVKTIIYLIVKETFFFIFRDKNIYPFWQNYAYEVLSRYFSGIGQEWHRCKNPIF